jgi:hypothetical protein
VRHPHRVRACTCMHVRNYFLSTLKYSIVGY